MSELARYLEDQIEQNTRLQGLTLRERAAIIGVGHETVRQVLRGMRIPDDATLTRFAKALPGVQLEHLRELAQRDRLGPFRAPTWFDLLDHDERATVIQVGRQFLTSSGKAALIEHAADEVPVDQTPAQRKPTKRAAYRRER